MRYVHNNYFILIIRWLLDSITLGKHWLQGIIGATRHEDNFLRKLPLGIGQPNKAISLFREV